MTKIRASFIGLAALSLLIGVPHVTQAWNGGHCGMGSMPGFGYSGSLYGLGYVPVPPYFALHPPVYYGHRYYRSYGGSPFARRAVGRQPSRIAARMIINPHAARKPAAKPAPERPAAPDSKTAQAQMILNPFYHPNNTTVAQVDASRD